MAWTMTFCMIIQLNVDVTTTTTPTTTTPTTPTPTTTTPTTTTPPTTPPPPLLVRVANISFTCDAHGWGPYSPTYCVDTTAATYLPLPGKHFGYDVNWARFPSAKLWKEEGGDGLVWTDDIPICYIAPQTPSLAYNISTFTASVKQYNLSTTYCSWPDVGDPGCAGAGTNCLVGNSGEDESVLAVGEWGYDWYALPAQSSNDLDCGKHCRLNCTVNVTNRGQAFACVRDYFLCRVSQAAITHAGPPAPLDVMQGHFLWHHYACAWSNVAIIGSEVGENIDSIQAHLSFTRGAARQFHMPWYIDFSDWNAGRLHNYVVNKTTGKYDDANDGHSLSLRTRVAYVTYMAGANKHKNEDPSLFYNNLDNATTVDADGVLKLTPVGTSVQATHNFFVNHPTRGTPYVPIGIMLNLFHGLGLAFYNIHFREGSASVFDALPGQPTGAFGLGRSTIPYSAGDNVTALLLNKLWPQSLPMNIPPNPHDESKRMVNSPYADIFDVLVNAAVNNNGQPDYSYTLYDNYRVLYLSGDVNFAEEEAALPKYPGYVSVNDALRGWVERGGVIVVHADVILANNFSAWDMCMSLSPQPQQVRVTGVVDVTNNGSTVSDKVGNVTTYAVTSINTTTATSLLVFTSSNGATITNNNVTNTHHNSSSSNNNNNDDISDNDNHDNNRIKRFNNDTATTTIANNNNNNTTTTTNNNSTTTTNTTAHTHAVVSCRVGAGQAIVVLPPVAADLDNYNISDWLLNTITNDVTPFQIGGGTTQMLLNRRAGGWNITLVNNLGVTKYCTPSKPCTPDITDPSQAQALTVTLKSVYAAVLGNLTRVAYEHVTATTIRVYANNAFQITVPAGGVRIVAVDHMPPTTTKT